jgi:hypothetical protein
MDSRMSSEAREVLTEVQVSWEDEAGLPAYLIHAARNMLVLEGGDAERRLPAPGTAVQITSTHETIVGRVAEHGRAGRFLVALGDRPVRRADRLRVSLPASIRATDQQHATAVEIVDLTTSGARVRGVELPVGSEVNLRFVPPGRSEAVTVRAQVVHATHDAAQPWVGVAFRLVALRGGRG